MSWGVEASDWHLGCLEWEKVKVIVDKVQSLTTGGDEWNGTEEQAVGDEEVKTEEVQCWCYMGHLGECWTPTEYKQASVGNNGLLSEEEWSGGW